MKRKELIKIINSIVLTSYILNISPVMAMDDEASDIFSFEDIIEEENVAQPEDNCGLKKEEAVSDDLNNDNEIFNDDNFVIDLENDMKSEDSDLKEENDIIISDAEGGVPLDNDLISEDVSEEYKDIEEYDDVISSEIEDNWLNREVARQIYGNGDRYTDLTDDDYLKITTINLSNKGLSGKIPKEIGKLTNLKDLRLYNNNLSGSIPEEIGNLRLLEKIGLQDNSLNGVIPESIGNLTKLVAFDIYNNNISGIIPETIGNLTNLDYLSMDCNNLTGSIPESIGNLKRLTSLYLNNNNLTGVIPESIGNLTSLKIMALQYNNLTGFMPETIGNLRNLVSLYLNNNNLTGSIPESINSLSNLTRLYLNDNCLSGEVSENLINKFTTNSFKSNFLNNVENQKYIELTEADDIVLELGEKASIPTVDENITIYNYDGTIYGDGSVLNCSFEYEYDRNILDGNFIGIDIGSSNIIAKMSGTEIVSKNSILVEVRDTVKPNIDATVSTRDWTTGDVEIYISTEDNDCVEKVILPDGSESRSNNFVCTVSENGEYTFIAVDRSGNTSSVTVVVNNIDREMPSIQLSLDKSSWTNGSVGIKMVALDDGKISKVILPDGSETKLTDLIYNVTSNGDYEFIVVDGAGNTSKEKISVKNIDNKKPTIKLSASNVKADNSIDITVIANDDESGIENIEMSDGTKLTLNNNIINVKKNGIYKFVVTDKAGNVNESVIEITNIIDKSLVDKEAPVMSYILSESDKTNKDVLINVMATDNKKVDYIVNPDGSKTSGSASIYKVDKNGKYKFEAVDTSGNKSEIIINISNIDKEGVFAFVNQSELLPDDTVDLVLNLNKAEEEIKSIKVNGTVSIDVNSPTLNVDKNGTYQFFVEDKANNTTIAATKVDSIPFEGEDFEKPVVNYLLDTYSWVNDSVGICVYASDNQGIKSIRTPDGNIVEDNAITYIVEDNGVYEFEVEDLSGNIETLTVDISNIDKVSPFVRTVEEEDKNDDKTTVVYVNLEDEESGIDNVILPNNVLVKCDSFTMTIEKDIEYEVIAKDKAGNENKITIKVESDKDSSNDNLGQDSDSSNKLNNEASSNKPSSGESNNSANNDKDSNLDNSDKNNQDKADSEEDKKSDLVKDETLSEDDENSIEGNGESIIEMFSWEDTNKEDKMLILMAMVIGVVGFAVMFIVVIGKKEEDDDNIEEQI